MGFSTIDRAVGGPGSVSVTNDLNTTQVIEFAGMCGGAIWIPTGSSLTSLTFHSAPHDSAQFLPHHAKDGTATTMTVAAGKGYQLPGDLFGAPYLKIVGNASGNVTFRGIG